MKAHLAQGSFPDTEAGVIRELATLLEYGIDHANKELVEGLIRVLDIVAQRIKLEPIPGTNFLDQLSHLSKLGGDIPRWESELMARSLEESASLVD